METITFEAVPAIIKAAKIFTAKSKSRGVMQGIHFSKTGDIVAGNGHAMFIAKQAFVVPPNFKGITAKPEQNITIGKDCKICTVCLYDGDKSYIRIGNSLVSLTLMDGQYGDYENCIPDYHARTGRSTYYRFESCLLSMALSALPTQHGVDIHLGTSTDLMIVKSKAWESVTVAILPMKNTGIENYDIEDARTHHRLQNTAGQKRKVDTNTADWN